MYRVSEVMSRVVISVTPDATVRTAVELLQDHPMHLVPVVDGDHLCGVIETLRLSLYDGEVAVDEVMEPASVVLAPDTPLSRAARLMRQAGCRQAPVLEAGQLVGFVSERELLSVWGVVNDHLTGLPAQFHFRRWISQNLAGGREITILFLDLDSFGEINKVHGHVIGDAILRQVGEVLRTVCDPDLDLPCRYGGDEFAVATTRLLSGAELLAQELRDQLSTLTVNGCSGVGVAIGVAGGRRSRPRPEAHIEATLDDLITRASTASTAAKALPERISAFSNLAPVSSAPATVAEAEEFSGFGESRPVLEGYRIGRGDDLVEVTVALRLGQRRQEEQVQTREVDLTRSIAVATARCLIGLQDHWSDVRVQDTYEFHTPQGLTCVGATISLHRPDGHNETLVGAAAVRNDLYITYIHAVLDAANRRLILPG